MCRELSEISIFGWNAFRVLATPQFTSIYLTIGRGPEILGRTTLQPTYNHLSGKNINSQPLGRPLQPPQWPQEGSLARHIWKFPTGE